ncbi:MAG: mannose-6-phosphate isomerase, class I [Anaerolineae bacterium]|jgi:mannose-6-phosphate isomerase
MHEDVYPLTFEPEFRDYIWGGRRLETLFGRQLPEGIVAESWDISGHPTSPTRVESGKWKGRTLPEVMEAMGTDLVGSNSRAMLTRGRFPLLVKLLDANDDLSVQVHPDDEYAAAHEGGELGKTEMWYVLYAEPGTELIYGLARGATRRSLRRAIENGTLEEQLHRVTIAPGDCFYVPAGTVHALPAGAVVAEIQQNSDTTYRVHDWGRVGADGRPRPLHVDKALDVIDWSQIEPGRTEPRLLYEGEGVRRSLLVDGEKFTAEQITLADGAAFNGRCTGATFEIWGCIGGAGEIAWEGAPLALNAVRFALLPAVLGDFGVRSRGTSAWLRVYVDRQD